MKIRGRLSDSVSNGYKLFGQKTSRLFSAQACRRVAAVQEQLFLQKLSMLRVVLERRTRDCLSSNPRTLLVHTTG
jgi:hypothetical protein